MKEWVGVVSEGVGDAGESSFNDVDMVAPVESGSGSEVKGSEGVGVPSEADEGGNVNIAQLANGEDRVCSEVKGEVSEAVISGESGVRVPRLKVIECEFYGWEESVPHVHGESDVDGGKGRNDVIF